MSLFWFHFYVTKNQNRDCTKKKLYGKSLPKLYLNMWSHRSAIERCPSPWNIIRKCPTATNKGPVKGNDIYRFFIFSKKISQKWRIATKSVQLKIPSKRTNRNLKIVFCSIIEAFRRQRAIKRYLYQFLESNPTNMDRAIRGPSMMRLKKRISQFRLKRGDILSVAAHLCMYSPELC